MKCSCHTYPKVSLKDECDQPLPSRMRGWFVEVLRLPELGVQECERGPQPWDPVEDGARGHMGASKAMECGVLMFL